MKNFLFSTGCTCFTLILLCFAGCVSKHLSRETAQVPVIEGANRIGDEACFECHGEMQENFKKTIHGRIADFEVIKAKKGCESCHGKGSVHAESEDPADIIVFSDLSKAQAAALCLKCHTSGSLMDWSGSTHAQNDLACTDCHRAHSQATSLLAQQPPNLCYSCHQRIRAKTFYPSHHPIRENKMTCNDCHQPHGGTGAHLKTAERASDLCLNCHAAKQGPFIFEHPPVVEDCSICHDAHGTVSNNLLIQNEPFLCLQCHQFHFHPGKIASDEEGTDIYGRPTTSCTEGMTMSYTTKCTQCHARIHGSDLPSQSVSGQGKALTR